MAGHPRITGLTGAVSTDWAVWAVSAALTVLAAASEASAQPAPVSPVTEEQVVLVVAPTWDSTTGSLWRFERSTPSATAARLQGRRSPATGVMERPGPWRAVGAPIPVSLGRSGLRWGDDSPLPAAPRKQEGDGRSPAGRFALGDVWGYGPTAPPGLRLRYHPMTAADRCVDDPADASYNRIVAAPAGRPPAWRSAEVLRRDDELYRYLLVVRYNSDPPRPGAGSCIFLHIHQAPSAATAGCTAMAQDDLLTVLRWLDPARNPRLVQLPQPLLASALPRWGLADLLKLVPRAPSPR